MPTSITTAGVVPRTACHRPRSPGRRGGAVVELALTMGVLVSLTFGMVEFGYYFYTKNTLEGAAREGARAAIVSGATNTDVTTAVDAAMSAAGVPSSKYTTAVQDTSGNALTVSSTTSGTAVVVKVTATWSTIGAGFRPMNYIGGTKTVLASAVMRKE